MPAAATRADALRVRWSGVRDVGYPFAVGTIPGVAVIAVAGAFGEGIAGLASSGDGKDLAFRAGDSGPFGEAVRCASDGDYLLEDALDTNIWARVSVRTAFLSPTPQQARVYLKHQAGFMVLDKSVGGTTSLFLSAKNVSAINLENVKVWCGTANTTFNLGAGDVVAATESAALLIGTLTPNQVKQLGMKLTSPAIPGGREFVMVEFTWDSF